MDLVYLIVAFIALVFGAWIFHSGLRRWQRRHQPTSAAIQAETSPLTDFRLRPQLETFAGLLLIAWALRLIVLYALQTFSAQPGRVRQNPVTGRIELLPTSSTSTPLPSAHRFKE